MPGPSPPRPQLVPRLLAPLLLALCCCRLGLVASITVCVVHDPPFTICPSATYQGFVKDDSAIKGYDVELLRWILNDMNYTMDPAAGDAAAQYLKYAWRCGPELRWETVKAASHLGYISKGPWPLSSSTSSPPPPPPTPPLGSSVLGYTCDISIGDFTVLSSDVEFGSIYIPYYPTGAAILLPAATVTTDPWAFMKPFHWTLWLGFLCFIFTVPAIVFFVERLSMDGVVPLNRQGLLDLGTAQYQTLLAVFNLAVYDVLSLSAQVCIVSFCFMVLIVVQTYNAQLGALYVSSTQSTAVNSIDDLHDTSVGVLAMYTPFLQQKYPKINFVSYDADNTDSLVAQVLPDLDALKISAFVHDLDTLSPRVSQLPNPCKYKVVSTPLAYRFSYGFLLSSGWDRSQVLTQFFLSLVHAQEAFVDMKLLGTYVTGLPTCALSSSSSSAASGVTFKQLSGLFLVVGVVTGATLLAGVVIMVLRVHQAMKEGEAEDGDEDGATAADATNPSLGFSKRAGLGGSTRSMKSKRSLTSALSLVFVKQPTGTGGAGGMAGERALSVCASTYTNGLDGSGRGAGRGLDLDPAAEQQQQHNDGTEGGLREAGIRGVRGGGGSEAFIAVKPAP